MKTLAVSVDAVAAFLYVLSLIVAPPLSLSLLLEHGKRTA